MTQDGPSYRSDNVGTLARAVLTDPPDFSAVPALIEALEEAGESFAAIQVKQTISDVVGMFAQLPLDVDSHMRVGLLNEVSNRLRHHLEFLTYDYGGTCDYLQRVIGRLTGADQVQEGKKEFVTYRVRVPEHVRPGNRVPIDAVRQGIVISAPDAEGFAQVIEADPDGYGIDGVPPMGMAMGQFRTRRR